MNFMFKKKDFNKLRYTSKFGNRRHPIRGGIVFHRGIDIAGPVGTELIAPLNGVVIYNRTNRGDVRTGYGHFLCLWHEKERLYTFYAHLQELSEFKEGEAVKKGEVIGYMGNTGESTGPHLHFEIHEYKHEFPSGGNDNLVDPVKYYPELEEFYLSNLRGLEFETDWRVELRDQAIDELVREGKLNNPDYHKNKPIGYVEDWLFFEMFRRVIK